MSTKFKPGDKVRRLSHPYCGALPGGEYVVADYATPSTATIALVGFARGALYDEKHFELIEAAPVAAPAPVVDRVAQLADAFLQANRAVTLVNLVSASRKAGFTSVEISAAFTRYVNA